MSIITGKDYMARIDSLNNEIWIEGERVSGKLSEHPAFRGILKSKGELYDLQHDVTAGPLLTRLSPENNERFNFAFEQPTSKEALEKRREATQLWARKSAGTVGRSPDYVNTAIMTLGTSYELFKGRFSENIQRIFSDAMAHDLSFTHTFINPQVNRSFLNNEFTREIKKDNVIGAKVIDEMESGIVVHGARLLATQGGITDEILVLPVSGNFIDPSSAFGFSIPSNTPGVRFACRESYAKSEMNSFDYPFSSQFDEVDSVVIFDNVLVPWERVFVNKDLDSAGSIYSLTNLNTMLLYQAVCRQVIKTEFLLGLGISIANTIAITEYQHVHEKISEIMMSLEIMKSLLLKSEKEALQNLFGTMVPNAKPLMTAVIYYQKTYPRLVEILHLLGASGFISLPTEKDFDAPIGKDLEKYLQSKNDSAKDRVQLFRLAWDLTMSPFGSRQTQFERFFFGDSIRLSASLFNLYDRATFVKYVQSFLNEN
ncbi:MAG: 4-hydroxyphenylacetate 3-monooxygenase, oxygenase component [Paenisporosarcina sp.]